MTCEEARRLLFDAALGESSAEHEAHLSGCASCRAALAVERELLDRVHTELQDALDVGPSPTFLPAVRRRVASLRAGPESIRRRCLVPVIPALATLAGVLLVGYVVRTGTTIRTNPDPDLARPTERVEPVAAHAPEAVPVPILPERVARGSQPGQVPESPKEAAEVPSMPRVFVPAEDAEVVRRLARRLRGHAARAAVMAPDVEGSFDLTLKPIEDREVVVTTDHRVRWGAQPGFEEPPSFDRTVEKTGSVQ